MIHWWLPNVNPYLKISHLISRLNIQITDFSFPQGVSQLCVNSHSNSHSLPQICPGLIFLISENGTSTHICSNVKTGVFDLFLCLNSLSKLSVSSRGSISSLSNFCLTWNSIPIDLPASTLISYNLFSIQQPKPSFVSRNMVISMLKTPYLLGKKIPNFLLWSIKPYMIWPLPTSLVASFCPLHVDPATLAFLQVLKQAKLFPPQGLWMCCSLYGDYSFSLFS